MATIALDAMGGDKGPEITVPGAIEALELEPELELFLAGNSDTICEILEEREIGYDIVDRIKLLHTNDKDNVSMDEKNIRRITKTHKDSSMLQAIEITKDGKADGVVSAGNTGAFVSASVLKLKKLIKGGSFALGSSFPNTYDCGWIENDKTFILDLGANINSSINDMIENVKMAKTYLEKTLQAKRELEIGIIIPGELTVEQKKLFDKLEDIEGIIVTKIDPLNTINSSADMGIIDGFEGNILLKSCEGAIKIWKKRLEENIKENLIKLLFKPNFKKNIIKLLENGLKDFLDYELKSNSDIKVNIPNLEKKGSCLLYGIKDGDLSEKIENITKDYKKASKIGVLNIGEENGKGRKLEADLSDKLKKVNGIEFAGFIEANDLLNTDCDIVITDNETGYIAINSIKGIINNLNKKIKNKISRLDILRGIVKKIFNSDLFGKSKISKELKDLMKETEKGAILLGVSKVVIKAHGGADKKAFTNAILMANNTIENGVLEQIKKSS